MRDTLGKVFVVRGSLRKCFICDVLMEEASQRSQCRFELLVFTSPRSGWAAGDEGVILRWEE
jgi:hypothetical protein